MNMNLPVKTALLLALCAMLPACSQQYDEHGKTPNEIAAENREDGKVFLAANSERPDVIETGSGLQYQVLRAGDGPKPTARNTVKVHYLGTLIDGTKFDSSYDRGEPAVFPLNRVISGWTEGLQLMSVGSKYRLFLPSNLAYGSKGAGDLIGPNATLIFEVELLGIEN